MNFFHGVVLHPVMKTTQEMCIRHRDQVYSQRGAGSRDGGGRACSREGPIAPCPATFGSAAILPVPHYLKPPFLLFSSQSSFNELCFSFKIKLRCHLPRRPFPAHPPPLSPGELRPHVCARHINLSPVLSASS